MKTKILGTGLNGLVGSRVVELLSDNFEFENLSLETGTDITNREQVEKRIADSPAGVILHLAAKTDVDACEKDKKIDKEALKIKDFSKFSNLATAWSVNVEGTRNIADACKKDGKKIIYISTDFVFDGASPSADGYDENSTPNPINWYGVTKYEGEKVVKDSGVPYLTCRLAFPYRSNFPQKKDFVRGILGKLKLGNKLQIVEDEIITPTFVDDLAIALKTLIEKNVSGIYHAVGSSSHSPLELAYLIADKFDINKNLINKTIRSEYFANRAPRPFSLILKNDKLRKLGIKMLTFEEGLEQIKQQMLS